MNKARSELEKVVVTRQRIPKTELEKLKRKQFEIGNSSSSSKYEAHVYQVFLDTEFRADIEELRKKLEGLYYKGISLRTYPSDEHLLFTDRLLIKELADRYRIHFEDLGFFADGHYDSGDTGFGRRISEYGGLLNHHYQHSEYDSYLCYIIGTKTSLEDIEKDWPLIRSMRQELFNSKDNPVKERTRTKAPEHPQLIYAVFKARMGGKKFSEIYKDYEINNLRHFTGNNFHFSDDDSLERYYRKHMPEVQSNLLEDSVHERIKHNSILSNDSDPSSE